ncbi:MAG: hypothetical protein AB8G96_10640 [Phycisphaerales bacterium]
MSHTTFSVILLAGSIRSSDLQRDLGVSPLQLPLEPGRSLLAAWCELFMASPGFQGGVVAVQSDEERKAISAVIDAAGPSVGESFAVEVDPAAMRGMAGLVRDLAPLAPPADAIMAVEAYSMPPMTIEPLLAPGLRGADVIVAADEAGEAAGVYALSTEILEFIRPIGYCDLKEQLLPELHARGRDVRSVTMTPRAIRVRDREGYLDAVAAWAAVRRSQAARAGVTARVAAGTQALERGEAPDLGTTNGTVAEPPKYRVRGTCVVDPTARVDGQAMLDECVVLAGAVVGPEAIVSRSIVGAGAVVPRAGRIVGRILLGDSS